MSARRRVKWEPTILMVAVLGLGLWIAFGPASRPHLPLREGALTQELRIGDKRGVLEATPAADSDDFVFRILLRDTAPSRDFTRAEAEDLLGREAVAAVVAPRRNFVFRTLNITSWVGVVWLAIGLMGQLAFSGRMILQWITSERRGRSVIGESFWWFSLFGSLMLFSYFVWRQDPVAILGQASGIVVYVRNLRLIYKERRRLRGSEVVLAEAEAAAEPTLESAPRREHATG